MGIRGLLDRNEYMTKEQFITLGRDEHGKIASGVFSNLFLTHHPSGPFTERRIREDLSPIGGTEPLAFAMEKKSPGLVNQAYRSYLANRIRQGRLPGDQLPQWNKLESAAQMLLDRISYFRP